MISTHSNMKKNINMLGHFLGQTISEVHGDDVLELIEKIRKMSKKSYQTDPKHLNEILNLLTNISIENIVPVARAFSHFLNLVNIAEQCEYTAQTNKCELNSPRSIDRAITKLLEHNISKDDILKTLNNLLIELVLTAHPTEVTRRSLVYKHAEISKCLTKLEYQGLTENEISIIKDRLLQLISQSWHTKEIRNNRPTPIEEAKWGFAVIENSLWKAVPAFLRKLNKTVNKHFSEKLDLNLNPILFSSWMGGDRDGNPFVTAKVTEEVINMARWRAADLFLKDTKALADELSVVECSEEFRDKYGDHPEPYRIVTKELSAKLKLTIEYFDCLLSKTLTNIKPQDIIMHDNQLWEPLYDCYRSLCKSNMRIIADGPLLDCLYRIRCFGVILSKLDVRQDSAKHTSAMAEITNYIGLGDYASWSESEKEAFLINELESKRPLVPTKWSPTEETKEILDTFKVIAKQPEGVITNYVISMAKSTADVLLVHLFLKEVGCPYTLAVTPLFETLEDLSNARSVMQDLFNLDWYAKTIQNKQMVMIGYSDSAKDAGMMAASWAQYRSQEELISLAESKGIELTLFHGRGGTIGRGGAPAHEALLSQPPKSLKNGLRVTEQGEMIRFKLGLPEVALDTLELYASAILEANLLPPPEPKQEWRNIMEVLSESSYKAYSKVVKDEPEFIAYFREATPEQELTKLPLGSRPAKRYVTTGIEGLRAIPWIFAWTQNRLMLPTWLGAGQSLQYAIDQGHKDIIDEMCNQWPFFVTRIGMLEMIYSKVNLWLVKQYESRLVEPKLHYLGKQLRDQFKQDVDTVLSLTVNKELMADLPWIAETIAQRNIYTDPLNLLQIELLSRLRNNGDTNTESVVKLEQALMIVIGGIAAGMRNTG